MGRQPLRFAEIPIRLADEAGELVALKQHLVATGDTHLAGGHDPLHFFLTGLAAFDSCE